MKYLREEIWRRCKNKENQITNKKTEEVIKDKKRIVRLGVCDSSMKIRR